MDMNWKTFRFAALVQLLVLIIGFCCWFYLRTVAYLNGPPDPDTYAQTWSFQLFVGVLYLLAALLLGATLILIEACVYWLAVRMGQNRQRE